MTEPQITDQDRRDARQWAERIMEHNTPGSAIGKAAHVILATVDAPAPTLAEELREFGETPATERDMGTFGDIADRVEQVEQERDQAKKIAELNLNTAAEMKIQRDNLRAEVERLTAERDREKNISKGWMEAHQKLAEHHAETLECAVQKDAESSDLPDPADVPEGQAWVVSIDDMEETAGFKASGFGWICYRELGGTTKAIPSDRITLVSRLVPAPRQITTREILDEAPRRTVIRDKDGVVCERASLGDGWYSPESTTDQTDYIKYPATVLWTPEVPA